MVQTTPKKEGVSNKLKLKKKTLTLKEKRFCREIVKIANNEPIKQKGHNGKPRSTATQAALNVYDIKTGDKDKMVNSASTIAASNLRKLHIRNEIAELLNKNGVELDGIVQVHKRNMEQSEHLPTSQKAVQDFYRILGLDTPQVDSSVKIAFIIQDKGSGSE